MYSSDDGSCPLAYQNASVHPCVALLLTFWSAQWESNPRRSAWKAGAYTLGHVRELELYVIKPIAWWQGRDLLFYFDIITR